MLPLLLTADVQTDWKLLINVSDARENILELNYKFADAPAFQSHREFPDASQAAVE